MTPAAIRKRIETRLMELRQKELLQMDDLLTSFKTYPMPFRTMADRDRARLIAELLWPDQPKAAKAKRGRKAGNA